jgi:hypothetical protein
MPAYRKEKAKPPAETKDERMMRQEEERALETFNEILELVSSTTDRQKVLPQIEKRYAEIIRDYPGTPLAQECYWRLIMIYAEDYSPPEHEKAEQLYQEFVMRYPDSGLKGSIQETLGKSYYKNAEWNKLISLTSPEYAEHREKGKLPRPRQYIRSRRSA